jgi:hypothetical protein
MIRDEQKIVGVFVAEIETRLESALFQHHTLGKLDSADAYDQPALLYRMSSAGMTKDHALGHSTYDHIPPFIPPLYSTFQQLVPFFIYALVSTILTRASYYNLGCCNK